MKFAAGVVAAISVSAGFVLLTVASILAQSSGSAAEAKTSALPIWAYPVPSGDKVAPKPDDGGLKHVPGSTAGYTKKYIGDLFTVPDWFPNSHPPMPEVVSQGRKPAVGACAYCHLPNGAGRPENESLAGLPEAYMIEQMQDFKNGLRKSSEPRMASVNNMIRVAKNATPEEMKAGAAYFSAMKRTPWIRVVETGMVPKTRIAGGMLVLAEGGGMEPIGERVIEVPENMEQTELRDSKSGFVAYVPTGSLKRGAALVKTGGDGKTIACASCHGLSLRGTGNVPSIAGRSPSQMARQIIDFQNGSRNGAGAQLMRPTVSKLTSGDIVVITGYLASLKP